jgi:hypothetical protein
VVANIVDKSTYQEMVVVHLLGSNLKIQAQQSKERQQHKVPRQRATRDHHGACEVQAAFAVEIHH